ncbi:MAG: hypothetical protein ABSF77_20560 [Spirochaetia bacterium]|jgi:hypothetical protein
MFGFLIKKAFFDMWDNMFRIILMNLGYIAVLAIFFLLAPLFISLPVLFFITIALGIAALAVYTGAVSKMCAEIADYRQPGFAEFAQFIKASYPSSLLLALVLTAYVFIISIAFQFYGGMKTIVGPLAVALLFWVTVAWTFASQYFFPIQSRLDKKFRKIFRKTFLVFFDNPGFSIGLLLSAGIVLVISVFTALLLPGISSIILWWNIAFKLRLYKYDWLEQNPGANRRRVPWDALLVDDRERVGKRTLKGMIFPWRE